MKNLDNPYNHLEVLEPELAVLEVGKEYLLKRVWEDDRTIAVYHCESETKTCYKLYHPGNKEDSFFVEKTNIHVTGRSPGVYYFLEELES
jgi:hypothetical protein